MEIVVVDVDSFIGEVHGYKKQGASFVPEVGTSWLMTRRLGYQAALGLYVRGRHLELAEVDQLRLALEPARLPGNAVANSRATHSDPQRAVAMMAECVS